MIETWIPITVAAAFMQNLRSALQKHLQGRLSNSGAAYARFLFALPFALAYTWSLHRFGHLALPEPNALFFTYCFLGGLSQILFTVFLLWMFSFRSFAVGTTFSKLEVVMVAILGALILGDGLNSYAIAGILLSALGVMTLSIGQSDSTIGSLLCGLAQKSTLIGLICAAWLGGSVVFFRGASLSLNHGSVVMAAAFTLAVSLCMQTVMMGVYLAVREPGEIGRVIRHWPWAGAVGLTGALASVGWFTAFTMQNAGYVRALGQVELLFTFAATTLIFRETIRRVEVAGIALVAAGILLIVLMR